MCVLACACALSRHLFALSLPSQPSLSISCISLHVERTNRFQMSDLAGKVLHHHFELVLCKNLVCTFDCSANWTGGWMERGNRNSRSQEGNGREMMQGEETRPTTLTILSRYTQRQGPRTARRRGAPRQSGRVSSG